MTDAKDDWTDGISEGRSRRNFVHPMRLTFILLVASVLISRAEETAIGRWEGSAQIREKELRLIVDLAQDKGGAWIGSIIIPGLNVTGAALTDITIKGADITFAIKSALGAAQVGPATFKGHLTPNAALAGDFTQAGNTAPFALQKTGPPQVEMPGQSTVIAKEAEGEWKGDYELFGYARKVTIKLANRPTEGATAELVVVGKKTNNLPVDLVTQEGDFLTIDSHETGISFEGKLARNSSEIKGTFNQGGIEVPLALRRTQ
jgi:hypothetical protein